MIDKKKPKQMLLYKVVEKGTRQGTNMTIFLGSRVLSDRRNALRRIKRSLPEYLRPRYIKGRVIKAHPDTVGLMCFKSEKYAYSFISDHESLNNTIIIKVRGILRENQKVRILSNCGGIPTRLLRDISDSNKMYPATGTVFCDQVEVLE